MRCLHISASQLRQYLRCPREYELARVRGIAPAFVPSALAFGTAIHEGLAHFYREHMVGRMPTLAQMMETFETSWERAQHGPVPLRFGECESWESLRGKGCEMLAAFVAVQPAEPPLVEAVEMPFEVELHDPITGEVLEEKLVGAIDAVVREGERSVLLEHKTSARRYGEDQLRFDFQVTAYKMAVRQLGMGEVGLRYQVITKATKPAVQLADVERDAEDEADFLSTTVGVLRAIDAAAFFPIRGWVCRSCSVRHACISSRP